LRYPEAAHDALERLRAMNEHVPDCPKGLAELRERALVPIHPFRRYLEERGVSLAEAATLLRCSLRTVAAIVNDWRRPRDADIWARCLGYQPDELFPAGPPKA
jgi:hypothetical protein